MKRRWQNGFYITLGLALVTLLSLAGATVSAEESNLVKNPGFELGVSPQNVPQSWRSWHSGGYTATFGIDSETKHTGDSAAKITASTATAVWIPSSLDVSPVVEPGNVYKFTAFVKATGMKGKVLISIRWLNAVGAGLKMDSSKSVLADTDWTLLEVTGEAPANAKYAQIRLESDNNAGTAWFDDLTFYLVTN